MSTRAERAQALSAVTHARQRGKADPQAATEILAETTPAKRDLDSPALQYKIENPETMSLVLDLTALELGEHEIVIKTAFSYADVNDRKVIEDLDSYTALFGFEISRIGVALGDTKWQEHPLQYLDIVARESIMREKANAILAKISTYRAPWTTMQRVGNNETTVIHKSPTVDELTIGIDALGAAAVASFLIGRVDSLRKEHIARKNSQKAAASG